MDTLFSTERIDACIAREEELDRILEIQNHPENRGFTWLNNREEYQELLREDGIYLLAFRERGKEPIIGYAILWHNKPVDALEFRRLALMKKGCGYGQEILRGVQKLAFTRLHVHRLWLETYTFNHRGIYIYEKLNFKREGTQRDVYKDQRGYLSEHLYSMLEDEYEPE